MGSGKWKTFVAVEKPGAREKGPKMAMSAGFSQSTRYRQRARAVRDRVRGRLFEAEKMKHGCYVRSGDPRSKLGASRRLRDSKSFVIVLRRPLDLPISTVTGDINRFSTDFVENLRGLWISYRVKPGFSGILRVSLRRQSAILKVKPHPHARAVRVARRNTPEIAVFSSLRLDGTGLDQYPSSFATPIN